jgi:hypothetical protein
MRKTAMRSAADAMASDFWRAHQAAADEEIPNVRFIRELGQQQMSALFYVDFDEGGQANTT